MSIFTFDQNKAEPRLLSPGGVRAINGQGIQLFAVQVDLRKYYLRRLTRLEPGG